MLDYFIEYFGDIYGEDYITSNVHNLSHLVDDVKKFGILSRFTSYPFENKLYTIKNCIRSGHRPLAQIAKRLGELSEEVPIIKHKHQNFSVLKKPFLKKRLIQNDKENELYFSYINLKESILEA